jgi:hypothetical protein
MTCGYASPSFTGVIVSNFLVGSKPIAMLHGRIAMLHGRIAMLHGRIAMLHGRIAMRPY